MDIKVVDSRYRVSDQLTAADLDILASQGIQLVVNFRPDGEGGDAQPTSADLAAKAASLGMAYAHIPVVPNQVMPAHVHQLQSLLAQHAGPVLGFCRTGNRANQVYQQAQAAPAVKPACCQGDSATETGVLGTVKGWFK